MAGWQLAFLAVSAVTLAAAGMAGIAAVAYCGSRTMRPPEGTPEQFVARARPAGPVVVCCGDSLVHGHHGFDVVGALRRSDRVRTYVNAGGNGDLAWNLAERLDPVIACRPDVVTILIGTNDAMGSQLASIGKAYVRDKELPRLPAIDWYEEALDGILGRLAAKTDAAIGVITLPWLGEREDTEIHDIVRAHNEVIRNLARRHGATVIPLFESLARRIDDPHDGPAYRTDWMRRWRVSRSVFLHYLLGWSWDRTGNKDGLRVLSDHIHLNETGGRVLEGLIAEFVEDAAKR